MPSPDLFVGVGLAVRASRVCPSRIRRPTAFLIASGRAA
jgi:hypothetical protein